MDLDTLKSILSDPFSGTLLAIMTLLAALDFVVASFARWRDQTYTLALVGHWVTEKGIAIAAVVLLFALAKASDGMPVPGTGLVFVATAALMAASFSVTHAHSIVRNLRPAEPFDASVLEEATGA